MFSQVTRSYDLTDATLEIICMLLVAFLLGYLLALLIYRRPRSSAIYVSSTWEKQVDNLKIIEGIGPKIESLLNKSDVYSFVDVVNVGISWLQDILDEAGTKYQIHNPKTWPDQAELAMEEKWSELKEYQDLLTAWKEK